MLQIRQARRERKAGQPAAAERAESDIDNSIGWIVRPRPTGWIFDEVGYGLVEQHSAGAAEVGVGRIHIDVGEVQARIEWNAPDRVQAGRQIYSPQLPAKIKGIIPNVRDGILQSELSL